MTVDVSQIETLSECVALKDLDLVYRACSPGYARAMGFASPEQLIGKSDVELFQSARAMVYLKLDSEVALTGKSNVFPLEPEVRPSADRNRRLILRKPVHSADKRVVGIDISIINAPSEKPGKTADARPTAGAGERAEIDKGGFSMDHLTTSKSDISVVRKAQSTDFQQLMNNMPNGVLIVRGAKIVYANRAAANIFGFASPVELIRSAEATTLLRLDEWAKRNPGARLPVSSVQSRLAEVFELQGVRKGGQSLVLSVQAREVVWLNNKAVQLSFVDNTEQALSEQMLIESEQRFRNYAEASADFFWEMDRFLRFSYLSEEVESALGVSVSKLLGASSQDLARNGKSAENSDHWTEQLDRLLHHQRFKDFEFTWAHPDGSTRVIRYSGVPVFNEKGQFCGYRGSGRDITGTHQLVEAVTYHASHDSMTGLVNRRKFEEATRHAINSARDDQQTHALCFLDLDNFKIVNDTSGHEAGDELLRQLAALFQAQVRKSDVLARIGGDEFAVLLYNCGVSEALRLANQLRSEVENFQFLWKDNRFSIGVSVGVVLVDKRWENTSSLFRAADMACYLAKDAGRNRVVVYQDSETQKNIRQGETHWVDQINAAISDKRLKISAQKILPLKKNGRNYFEILMRLETSAGAIINPQAFLPAAERYGLATRLDENVLDLTLDWLRRNPRLIDELGMCSINLTGQSFASEVFSETMQRKIANSGVPAHKLCLELSETATIANLSSATKFIHHLGELGCRFALDNFGSGLSSFAYLKNLPVQYLKIDGRFVRDILDDPIDHATVRAINEIGQALGKQTVATCVENSQLLSAVTDLGVDFAQGYHIGSPEILN
ncbi:MAG: EAL domain-containing protein [Gammaproteobacteria bacterium]|nr:EAL domain-containing protein [Gammaproteobacteria bacterium]